MLRLDTYIQEELKRVYGVGVSRQFVEKLLENGGVVLNDEIIKKKGFKFNPDVAKPTIDPKMAQSIIEEYQTGKGSDKEATQWSESDPVNAINLDPDKLARAGDLRRNIIFENDDFMVVYKPPGVLSHPGKGDQNRDSMVYQFIKYMNEVHKYIPRAGLLHRLDLETQGILLFAKNMESYNMFKRDFEQRQIHKYYFAQTQPTAGINNLVRRSAAAVEKSGADMEEFRKHLETDTPEVFIEYMKNIPAIELDGYIGNVRGTPKMRFDLDKKILLGNNTKVIKDCHSSIAFLKGGEAYGAIVQPHTGRTHQIRTQLKFLGVPCKNDRMYGHHITQGGMLKLSAIAISFTFKDKKYSFSLPVKFLRNVF